MAKIKGIELKGIKNTVGMEGSGFYANIYLDGKKIGTVADYADGGAYNYDFDSKELREEMKHRILKFYRENPPVDNLILYKTKLEDFDVANLPKEIKTELGCCDMDSFFCDLCVLKETQTQFKKAYKQGKSYCVVNYYHLQGVPIPLANAYTINTTSAEEAKKIADKLLTEERKKYAYAYLDLYTSLADFIIE